MAKRKMPSPEELWRGSAERIAEMRGESDRGTCLIVAATLDEALAGVLRANFLDDSKKVRELLENDGPLGTFAARIKLAHCLGLIGEVERKNLDIIRDIRNVFAHSHARARLDEPPARDQVAALKQVFGNESPEAWRSAFPREYFMSVASGMTNWLMNRAFRARHAEPAKDVPRQEWADPSEIPSRPPESS